MSYFIKARCANSNSGLNSPVRSYDGSVSNSPGSNYTYDSHDNYATSSRSHSYDSAETATIRKNETGVISMRALSRMDHKNHGGHTNSQGSSNYYTNSIYAIPDDAETVRRKKIQQYSDKKSNMKALELISTSSGVEVAFC
mmetsp:Transcript_8996/g.15013  ORF Transcript_8996/g.15013 Transcript_8996/m.15013 type:complete len:141 (+) Transcript_8996:128-550(+)|eukprot:CAMPEP_0119014678 /NCGR_PEP_ID=MMETSP1176-20130426/10193_1 /TAXON_ID=265551 /ORGANISM="Synedropsis recta cf, Strain CCMP1620" /LENGTH=140 /DNA_ID=CAMNT_0006967899 /DNA_START=126 /DNA_END=548 /DNA_ORIENTATION=+